MDTTNLDEMIMIFGTRANIARKLKINSQAVYQWRGKVPPLRALQLERIILNAVLQAQDREAGDGEC